MRLFLLLCALSAGLCASNNGAQEAASPTPANDRLVELIRKKNLAEYEKELGKPGLDFSAPDSKGRVPLIESVRSRDARFVKGLLGFSWSPKLALAVVDTPTGNTPLHEALKVDSVEVVKLLLAYGADVNATNKAGKKPRDSSQKKEFKDMMSRYEELGPVAFEDPPGSWLSARTDQGIPYWFNRQTSEARWSKPPSCAWQRIDDQKPPRFFNYVTGQTLYTLPDALAWRLLTMDGKDVFYNWRTNKSQFSIPGELSPELLEEVKVLKNVYYYNPRSNSHSWEHPDYHVEWRAVKHPEHDATFYFNVKTGEATWEQPAELSWMQVEDKHSPRPFWWNPKTNERQWHEPDHKAWHLHRTEL